MSRERTLGLLGIVGGLLGIALSFAFASTGWGAPGTAAYRTYEMLNRLTGIALLLMAGGWLGLARIMPKGVGRLAAWLVFAASTAMFIGNVAEFWLFTDQPYGELNARSWSWMAYLFGELAQIIGSTILGIEAWRKRLWPRWLALALMLVLPLILLTFGQISAFFAPSILALIAGWILLWSSAGNSVSK